MNVQPREIRRYTTAEGTAPFTEWVDALRDRNVRVKIKSLIIVVIPIAGDKSTQEQNIRQAIEYWTDYEKRESTDK
ncbi:hypothetical protein QUB14_11795 [Microcoleus sp. B3-D2]